MKDGIERIAKQVSRECEGFPLAINLIVSSMIGKSVVNAWELSLTQMQRMDFIFPIAHHLRINWDLFRRLRWSYDCLYDFNLKNYFRYCAMFPQDISFCVKSLVQMWITEDLVTTKDFGQSYVKILENRHLFQVEPREKGIIVRDDVLEKLRRNAYLGQAKCFNISLTYGLTSKEYQFWAIILSLAL